MSETSSQMEKCRCDYSYLRKKKGPKFQGQSTTKATYKPYQLQKQVTYQTPKPITKHYDPQVMKSSYKMQYQKPAKSSNYNDTGMSQQSLMNSYRDKSKKVPFYSETEYKKSFQPKPVQVEKQPTYEYKPKNTRFEGVSSYKQQYIAKKNPDLLSSAGQQILNQSKQYFQQKNKVKFEGESAYKNQFQKYDVKPEKQPQYQYKPKNTHFEGASNYKQAFTKPPQQVYKNPYENCPIHPDRIAIK